MVHCNRHPMSAMGAESMTSVVTTSATLPHCDSGCSVSSFLSLPLSTVACIMHTCIAALVCESAPRVLVLIRNAQHSHNFLVILAGNMRIYHSISLCFYSQSFDGRLQAALSPYAEPACSRL
ncbi:hypothetical protein CY34DRAFT_135818 [Suillus luteus UH-Slu-Lm8-n1]|uniref:Unplaced genomic scaffold CY34scaffold_103, whole genome shotgun sequence n=1 Tax=Suillus luteus UH-Slu-Lm8-n1 TaxID=930992 RepID=A0A0D0BHD3_9AGAM|nr:hypothetical protein CY34DRAFT_135818 [Suillus luteus UH-Slu-Lm8-n1]